MCIYRYNCNRYNETDAKSARDAQISSRAALERYLFYCNRYMNHLRSSKMEAKVREEREGRKEGERGEERKEGKEDREEGREGGRNE